MKTTNNHVLTENFTLAEMIKSDTAEKRNIDNVPNSQDIIDNLTALCENVLQPARDQLGSPIIVNSGYRCPQLNLAVGGVVKSQHLQGQAADIRPKDMTQYTRLWAIMLFLPFDQLIDEIRCNGRKRWIHVSFRRDGRNRRKVLTIKK